MIGFQQDIDRIGRREVQEFFESHYGPDRLVVAIAGDVKPEQASSGFGGAALGMSRNAKLALCRLLARRLCQAAQASAAGHRIQVGQV